MITDKLSTLTLKFQRRIRHFLKLPKLLVRQNLLGREFLVRDGTIRARPDYDDAWLLACALHAQTVFDIGANVGYDALLAFFSNDVRQVVLVDPNPEALTIAAENMIRNQLAGKCRFVPAFVDSVSNQTVKFWTIRTGAAGSKYETHAKSAKNEDSYIEVKSITLDQLCVEYKVVPDLVKIDVEGAESGVLAGGIVCASQKKTRFLVEMHSNSELSMVENGTRVIAWCKANGYAAWYLKEQIRLDNARAIQKRGRCHLMLQPADWLFPDFLKGLKQSSTFEAVIEKVENQG